MRIHSQRAPFPEPTTLALRREFVALPRFRRNPNVRIKFRSSEPNLHSKESPYTHVVSAEGERHGELARIGMKVSLRCRDLNPRPSDSTTFGFTTKIMKLNSDLQSENVFTEGCEFDSDEIFRLWDLNPHSLAGEPGFGDGLLFKGNLETGIPGHPFKPGETRTRDLSISRVFSWCF